MSSIVLSGDTSGSVTVSVPAIAGTNTVTIPATTGTVMVSSNMPAFSAYQSSAQTLSGSTSTKIQLQAKEFDTANAFDSTTNYRFTPQVAGYYQINGAITVSPASMAMIAIIYKNGSIYKIGQNISSGGTTNVSSLVFLNGSTDYVELYGFIVTGQSLSAGVVYTYLNGSMVRAA